MIKTPPRRKSEKKFEASFKIFAFLKISGDFFVSFYSMRLSNRLKAINRAPYAAGGATGPGKEISCSLYTIICQIKRYIIILG